MATNPLVLIELKEDLDAVFLNGIETLERSGKTTVADLDPTSWQVTAITRTGVNYTGAERGDPDGEIYPVAAVGTLTANVGPGGLEWRWSAPNRAFDWMEDDRSVHEDWSFVSRETYLVTITNVLTGEVRTEDVAVAVTGNSDETFDILVLGSDLVTAGGVGGVQRVADNLKATGLADSVQIASFADYWLLDTRRFDSILVYTNNTPTNPVPVGNWLKAFVDDTNGGVVLANFSFNSAYALGGGIMGDGYASFDVRPGIGGTGTVGDSLVATDAGEAHPILRGIDLAELTGAYLRNSSFTRPAVDADARLLATDQNGTAMIAESASGRVISMNLFPRDLGLSNLGPDGESLLTPGEQELYELFINALYAASDDPLFSAPSAYDLTPMARTETVGSTTYTVYEAEDADAAGLLTQTGRNASGSAFLDFPTTDESLDVNWTVEVAEDGVYRADFLYALATGKAPRPLTLLVDGEAADVLPFLGNSNWGETVWSPQSALLELSAGRHTITLRAPEGMGQENGANLDYLRLSEAPVYITTLPTPSSGIEIVDGISFKRYEAEAATLSDAILLETGRGASGNVFVDFPATDESLAVSWTLSVAESGTYAVDVLYALAGGKGARPLLLSVDGDVVERLPFTGNSNWTETVWGPESFAVDLEAGTHVIALTAPSGAGLGNGANLDYLRISEDPLAPELLLA